MWSHEYDIFFSTQEDERAEVPEALRTRRIRAVHTLTDNYRSHRNNLNLAAAVVEL